jgi:hypothetical protein
MSTTPNHENTQFVEGAKKDATFFLRCFDSVRQHKEYWNKWIIDDGWIDIIEDRFDIPTNLKFVSGQLNRAIGTCRHPRYSGIDILGDSNVNGLYKATYFEKVKRTA